MSEPQRLGPTEYRPRVPAGLGFWSDPVPPDQRPALERKERREQKYGACLPVVLVFAAVAVMGVIFALASGQRWSFPGTIFAIVAVVVVLNLIVRVLRRR